MSKGECIICGTINDITNKKCTFCEDELVIVDKNRQFAEFIGLFLIYLVGGGSLVAAVVILICAMLKT